MTEERRVRWAMDNFAIAAVASIIFSFFLLLILVVPESFFKILGDRTLCLIVPSLIGATIGLFFGFFSKPEKLLWERGKKVGGDDIAISFILGILVGVISKRLIFFPLLTFSSIAICRLILGIRYLTSKH